ncbi:signal peptidase I [Paenibacillus sp. MBLB4367]|uniref:signal peptidase I n=1 Tax=Paenibacillus sp. MBLB4367 TaxID=3384767 RepID=UPI003908153B
MPARARAIETQLLSQHLAKQGYLEIASVGDSMYPLIREGDMCRFEPVLLEAVRKGDVLLFATKAGHLVGHRFLKQYGERGECFYVCKGDTNKFPDEPIRPQQIIGRLTLIRTASRRLIRVDGLLPQMWGVLAIHIPQMWRMLRWVIAYKRWKPAKRSASDRQAGG